MYLGVGLPGGFLLELLPGFGFAPFGFGLGCIRIDFAGIKFGKIHRKHSCLLNITGMGKKPVQLLPLQFQQMDLLLQGFHGLKCRRIQDALDIL